MQRLFHREVIAMSAAYENSLWRRESLLPQPAFAALTLNR
jgi:hypothetical protein